MQSAIETIVYTVTVRTLDHVSAGTSSTIKCKLADKEGNQFETRDLVAWGGWYEPDNYTFFQSNSLDVLYGLGKPFTSEPCYLRLIASGTGDKPTWGCDTVQVQSSLGEKLFYVREWLTEDNNYTIVRDVCGKVAHHGLEKGTTRITGSLPI